MSWDGSDPYHTKGDDINAAIIPMEGLLYVQVAAEQKLTDLRDKEVNIEY